MNENRWIEKQQALQAVFAQSVGPHRPVMIVIGVASAVTCARDRLTTLADRRRVRRSDPNGTVTAASSRSAMSGNRTSRPADPRRTSLSLRPALKSGAPGIAFSLVLGGGDIPVAPPGFDSTHQPGADVDLTGSGHPFQCCVLKRIFLDQPVSTWSENAPVSTNSARSTGPLSVGHSAMTMVLHLAGRQPSGNRRLALPAPQPQSGRWRSMVARVEASPKTMASAGISMKVSFLPLCWERRNTFIAWQISPKILHTSSVQPSRPHQSLCGPGVMDPQPRREWPERVRPERPGSEKSRDRASPTPS